MSAGSGSDRKGDSRRPRQNRCVRTAALAPAGGRARRPHPVWLAALLSVGALAFVTSPQAQGPNGPTPVTTPPPGTPSPSGPPAPPAATPARGPGAAPSPPTLPVTPFGPAPVGAKAPPGGGYRATEQGRQVERLLNQWRFEEADAQLATLLRTSAGTAEALHLEGYARFMAGDYRAAVAKLRAAAQLAPDEGELKLLAALATNAGQAIEGHKEVRSKNFVLHHPPEDEVLAEEALEALESALAGLSADLGFVPTRPITVDIYRSPSDLAAVSTLTVEEVENTGTIALCKWGRLMATTPRALSYGYPWLDSLSHELVHYVVSALSRDKAPVWLQEGLAKFLERRWRQEPNAELPPSMQHLLAKALASGKLISFERMHPSMAKLPTAEDATLAFAEVATAVASLHAKRGVAGLREAITAVRDGADARAAVAQAAGGSWSEFERHWKSFMAAQRYKTFPGMDPVTPKYRKPGAVASKRAPSEDESLKADTASKKHLRLGNMLLLRKRPRAAAIQYEKGAKDAGPMEWLFATKLGRTYLALDQPDKALKAVSQSQSLYPELPWPHVIAGRALLERGDAQGAIAALRTSLATNPFDPEVQCSLAEAYAKLPSLPAADERRRVRAERFCKTLR